MNDIILAFQVFGKILSPLFTGEGLFIVGLFSVGALVLWVKDRVETLK